MLIYAGIDEAGYGPLLGPLCVGCTAFIIHDQDETQSTPIDEDRPCDLWKRLNKVVCRKRTDKRNRIAVDDSKKLKGANHSETIHPLRFLERGVLGFHMARKAHECPSCDHDLFKCLSIATSHAAWYESTTPLPVAHTPDELRIASSRLHKAFAEESIECEFMRCETIDGAAFNHQVKLMGTKSSVNFCAVMRMIDAVWRRWPSEHARIVVDRLGGRSHYLRDLMTAFDGARIQILGESDVLSRYRLERDGSQITVSFLVEADVAHLPVALASMIAKYVRELMMIRMNRYFQSKIPELKPTAGYTEDARRYLADIDPLIDRLNIDRTGLIRSL